MRGHSDLASAGQHMLGKTRKAPSPLYDLLDFILQARRMPCAPDGVRLRTACLLLGEVGAQPRPPSILANL